MAVMRTYMRALQINKEPNEAVLKELGLTKQDVEDMYRLLAIAKYKDASLSRHLTVNKWQIYIANKEAVVYHSQVVQALV